MVQVSGFKQVLPASPPTTTQGTATTTESTSDTPTCDQDIVCFCLDVSGSMVVSIVDVVFSSTSTAWCG